MSKVVNAPSRLLNKRNWVIPASCVILFLLFLFFSDSLFLRKPPQTPLPSPPDLVDLTLLTDSQDKGALCLDGSAPGYHFSRGYGSGSDSWVLHIEGGGWCDSISSCSFRAGTALGSSKHMERRVLFKGILSPHPSENPDFYNWNRVKIRYCDGASFSGHPDTEPKGNTKLYFRGQLIWKSIMDELLSAGLSSARQSLLSGCSAGGLATLLHCDEFREALPKGADVKCLADAGFFLDEKDVSGNRSMRSFYHNVVQLQGVHKSLHRDCVAKKEPSDCFFPVEVIRNIRTPVFLVNPAYDFWQIQNVLVPLKADPTRSWWRCRLNIQACSPNQLEILNGFRGSLLKAMDEFQKSSDGGLFINSCFIHCQTWYGTTWHSPTSPRINNKTIAETIGDWYFNRRRPVREVDGEYPCNPTCINMDFT
ncbi:hypothetical protein MLD38_026508 [Melastoma candidum]|uniref:Uncharacterized protein n=1 Tax=Melastoma candidum TaxID=119954 RepID=A0ACB9NYT4_9MYRT|nr:hypothetical protein MLD38_026508 [Melastoma candidum]